MARQYTAALAAATRESRHPRSSREQKAAGGEYEAVLLFDVHAVGKGKAAYNSCMRQVCVFCGSSSGSRPEYRAATEELGAELVRRNIGLVYGGGKVGLMGVLADSVLRAGGRAVGVIPEDLLAREIGHNDLTKLHVVGSMHQRKALMADLADAFIALPGGFGTLEEFFEILTWAQLGLHAKACGILNVGGYYSPLLAMLDHAVRERFLKVENRELILARDSVAQILEALENWRPLQVEKWLDREAT